MTTGLIAVVMALVITGTAAEPAKATGWPQWRGPNRDGISPETGLLKQWPADGPKLLWDISGLGKGYSGVSVAGTKLFTMGDLAEGGETGQYVIAFDLATRKRLWKTKVGAPHSDGGARCTPTVDSGRVYALGTDGDLVCVQAATGQEVWRKSFPGDFGGTMMSGWKYSESPLIDGDRLICTPGGNAALIAALNKTTGAVIWKCAPADPSQAQPAGYSSIVVSEGAGVRQYVTIMGRGAVGVAAADGKLLWTYARVANGTANIATPVVRGDFVFVSTAYGTGSALLKLARTPDGVQASEVYFLDANTFQSHHGGFVRVGDYIYGAHGHNQGNPICIEMATGKVMWRQDQIGKGSGAVICAAGNLYYRYEDDTVALITAKPEGYELKGSLKIPGRPGAGGPGWAHPAIADGKLYIRHEDVLFCYDLKGL